MNFNAAAFIAFTGVLVLSFAHLGKQQKHHSLF